MNALRLLLDLIILNLLWLQGCFLIFTTGASTTALYQSIMKMRKGGSFQVWKTFWKCFLSNFRQATILLIIVAVGLALVAADVVIVLTVMTNVSFFLKIIMLLPAILVMPALGFVFPFQAQFENNIINTLKNARIMARIHIPASLVVLILNLIPVGIFAIWPNLFFQCVPLWITLGGSLIAYNNTAILQRVFNQYIQTNENET